MSETATIQGFESAMFAGLSGKPFLIYEFPAQRDKIKALTLEQKMEWYSYQFQKLPGVYPVELTTEEFKKFWKWQVLIPIKIKRFYFRLKNGELFKRYPNITEMKKKVKPHSI